MKKLADLKAYLWDKFFIKQPRFRACVTRMIYGSADREIKLFGTCLSVNSLAENGYLRAFENARSCSVFRDEASSLGTLFSILRPGDLFVDVGANIGVFACSVARLPGVKAVAFEANPDTFKRLKANAERHGVDARLVAVSDREQELEFCSGAVSHVFAVSTHRNSYHYGDTIKLKSQTLDGLLDNSRSIILKIDVEGHEPEVLAGAGGLFAAGVIHGVLLDASSAARRAAKFLESLGFRILDPDDFSPVQASSAVFLALSPARCADIGLSIREADSVT